MLQQTQLATARPYYDRFLARFPTLDSLARARSSDVLEAWAGLGYYRRARHLQEAARTVVREHGSCVPNDPEAFGRLPGVGRYTMGAVLSICFDRPLAVLDGNVARVLARLEALPAAIRDPRGARRLWALADSLVPMRRPGDWNQAMMELGATLCTPRAPACGRCPVRMLCRARALGRVDEFPPAGPRRAVKSVRRAVALIERSHRVLMVRHDGTLLKGLWEPPGVDLRQGQAPGPALRAILSRLGLSARLAPAHGTVRHRITHRAIAAQVWHGVPTGALPRSARLRWVDPDDLGVPVTAVARKITTREHDGLTARGAEHGRRLR